MRMVGKALPVALFGLLCASCAILPFSASDNNRLESPPVPEEAARTQEAVASLEIP